MRNVRSIFLSDIHLGTRACKAERLLDFLCEHEAEHLLLIGDIIDFWSMNRGIHWSRAQNTVALSSGVSRTFPTGFIGRDGTLLFRTGIV